MAGPKTAACDLFTCPGIGCGRTQTNANTGERPRPIIRSVNNYLPAHIRAKTTFMSTERKS